MATRTPRTAVLTYLSSVQTEDAQNKTVRRRSVVTKADDKRHSRTTSDDNASDETPRHLIQNMLSVYNTAQPATRRQKRVSMTEGSSSKPVVRKTAVRRSVTSIPDLENAVKKLTPRTNIMGFLEQAPQETPVSRQVQMSSESHIAPNMSAVLNEAGVSMVEDSFNNADKTQIMERGARFWGKRGRLNILPPQIRPARQTLVNTVQTPQPEVAADQSHDEEQASINDQPAKNAPEHTLNKDTDKSSSLSKDAASRAGVRRAQSEERNLFADVFGGPQNHVFTTSYKDLSGENHVSDPEKEGGGNRSVLKRHSDFDKTSSSRSRHNASPDLVERESAETLHASSSSSPPMTTQAPINITPRQLESPRRVSSRVRTSTPRNLTLDTLWQRKKGQTPEESKILASSPKGLQVSEGTVTYMDRKSAGQTETIGSARQSGSLKNSSPRTSRGSNLDYTKSPEMGVERRKSRTQILTHSSAAVPNSDSSQRTSRGGNLDHTQSPETGIEGRKFKTPVAAPSVIMQTSDSSIRTSRRGKLDHTVSPETGDKGRRSRTSLPSRSALTEQSSDFPVGTVAPVIQDIQERSRSNSTVMVVPLLNASGRSQARADPYATLSEQAVRQQMEGLGESQDPSVHMPSGLSASGPHTEASQHHSRRESSVADEDNSVVYSPLRTPKLKTRPTTPHTSTPVQSLGNVTSKMGLPGQKRKAAPSSRAAKKCCIGLPASVVKGAFTHFCNLRLTKEALPEVEKVSEQYMQHIAEDLEAYAVHAHRKMINETDVELLMKRQGFITNTCSLNTLIATYLPLELRQELIPIARSGNKVEPAPR